MKQDDRKRFTTAMILMAAVVLALSYYNSLKKPPAAPAPAREAPASAPAPGTGTAPTAESPASADDIGGPGEAPRTLLVRTREMTVRLSSEGAAIERLELVNHHPSAQEKDKPLPLLDADLPRHHGGSSAPRRRSMVLDSLRDGADIEHWNWRLLSVNGQAPDAETLREIEVSAPLTVAFVARRGEMEVHKTYTFRPEGFDLGMRVSVTNRGTQRRQVDYRVVGAAGIVNDDPESRMAGIAAVLAGRGSPHGGIEIKEISAADAASYAAKGTREKMQLSQLYSQWAAVRGNYFSVALMADEPKRVILAFSEPLDADHADPKQPNLAVGLKVMDFSLEPGHTESHNFTLRAGPQIFDQLDDYTYTIEGGQKIGHGLSAAVNFGYSWYAWLSKLLLQLLRLFARVIPNYGVSIALVTLAVKIALHPLSYKGQKSMQRMQELGPKIQELQKQLKGDPQKMQQAQMRLFKEEGVNPAGGCLPLLLQIPVFFALYGAIRGAFEFRQAPFLWVSDLSRPDAVMALDFLPWAIDLNLLPIIYAGLMMLQGFLQPLPAEGQARQTALMMRFMPLMFFFMFYNLPSAFVLYFTASSIFGLAESQYIKYRLRRLKAAAAQAGGGERPAAPAGDAKNGAAPAAPADPTAFWQAEAQRRIKDTKGRR